MEIGGLPVHILLLHLVVVLAPAVGALAIAYALRPAWRRALAWPLGLGAVLNAGASVLTAHYGEELEHAMPHEAAIELHAQWGDVLKWVAVAFLLATVLLLIAREAGLGRVGWLRWTEGLHRQGWLAPLATALVVALGLAMIVVTVITGHTGAAAAWADWRQR